MLLILICVSPLYCLLIGFILAYTLKGTKKEKNRLGNLYAQYNFAQRQRRDFELRFGLRYIDIADSEYQKFLQNEAGAIIVLTTLFPDEYEKLAAQLEFLMAKINAVADA